MMIDRWEKERIDDPQMCRETVMHTRTHTNMHTVCTHAHTHLEKTRNPTDIEVPEAT